MTKAHWAILAVAGLALGVGAESQAYADQPGTEEQPRTVPLDSLPVQVRDAILARAGGRAITRVEVQTMGGYIVYSAYVRTSTGITQIVVDANGNVVHEFPEGHDD